MQETKKNHKLRKPTGWVTECGLSFADLVSLASNTESWSIAPVYLKAHFDNQQSKPQKKMFDTFTVI